MNISRTITVIRNQFVGRNSYRNFRFSASNHDSSQSTQPKVAEEKFDFEDLKVLERTIRKKPKIEPFMKNVFVSIFDRELLAFPEILNKDETEDLEQRLQGLTTVFSDTEKSSEDRKNALKQAKMYAANVSLTNGGLAMNYTESLRYLDVISSDLELARELSDHWVALEVLRQGLNPEQYSQVLGDLMNGDKTISLCIKEKIAERVNQPDFRTVAAMDGQGVWYINGEKYCYNSNGYCLVLCATEANRILGFLVHPGVKGVSYNNGLISFHNTPATPLANLTDQALSKLLGASRLHAATLCRNSLKQAIMTCVDYVRPRVFSGKPLSEISTIRKCIGAALLDVYASESAEYFTAGLMDGYEDSDVELEMAMCRNFIASRGQSALLELLAHPAQEHEVQCQRIFQEMRQLASRGEHMDSINVFIAMNGIHHAGRMLSTEVKQMRNPLFHPGFIVRKIFNDRLQEKDDPKLNLFLAEHLHPSLRPSAEQLEYCVLRMRYACETMMARHGVDVASAYTELNRLAQAGSEILAMTAVLARASRSYCIGLRNGEVEMKLAACFVSEAKDRVQTLIREIDDSEFINLDHFKIQFGRKVLDTKTTVVELPTGRTYW